MCMSNWFNSVGGGRGEDNHSFFLGLWDRDSTSGDDALPYAKYANDDDVFVLFEAQLENERVFAVTENGQSIADVPSTGWRIESGEAIRWCGTNRPDPNVCISMEIEETP